MAAPPVKPEFGPTLPALARRRFGVREPVTIAAVLALIALFAFVMVTVRPGSEGSEQVVYRDGPEFNLVYAGDVLAAAEPRPGELVRLEGARGGQSAAVTVRPLELPPYEGDVAHGLLPAFASGHIDRLRAAFDDFTLRYERRARINDAPGYEVTFRAGPVRGTDVLLLPDELDPRGAVVLSLRREVSGRGQPSPAERRLINQAAEAFRSFHYGLDQET